VHQRYLSRLLYHQIKKKQRRAVIYLSAYGLYVFLLSILLIFLFVRKLYELVESSYSLPKRPNHYSIDHFQSAVSDSGQITHSPSDTSIASKNSNYNITIIDPSTTSNATPKLKIVFGQEHERLITTMTRYCLLNCISAVAVCMGFVIFVVRFQTHVRQIVAFLDGVIICCLVVNTCIYLHFSFNETMYVRLCYICHANCYKCVKGRIKSKLREKKAIRIQ